MKLTTPDLYDRVLPVHPDVDVAYSVEHKTASAVLTVIHGTGEIRIPTVARTDRGDFRELMDELVAETGHRKVRFVNYFEPALWRETYGEICPDDARRITDAVHGFDTEREVWQGFNPYNGRSYDEKDVKCLVGEWNPAAYAGQV